MAWRQVQRFLQGRAYPGPSNPLRDRICAARKVLNKQTAFWQEPVAAIVQIDFAFESLESREWGAQVLVLAQVRNGHFPGAAGGVAQRL